MVFDTPERWLHHVGRGLGYEGRPGLMMALPFIA
jgi:hypothetical protein